MRALLRRYRTAVLVAVSAGLPLFIPVFPNLPWWARLLILVAVVGGVGLREHLQNVKPHLDLAKKRNRFFDLACERALERLRQFDDTARLNIMEIRRKPIKNRSRFEMVYTLNMQNAADKD